MSSTPTDPQGTAVTSEFTPISAGARRTLEQELTNLREKRRKVAAAQAPEGEDNRMAQAMQLEPLDARIAELTAWLHWASTMGPPDADVISIGSIVTARFADHQERTIHIAVIADASDPLLVAVDSPLGRALLGCRAGDTISYATSQGQATALVLSVRQPPADHQ